MQFLQKFQSWVIDIRSVYTVAQINSYIKNMFTQDYLLKNLFVKGEVSNCKYHTSGHIYFTLKDPKGTVSCVMFAGNRSGLSFRMSEGQQVIVGGTVDVYERDGKYQLYAKQILLDGNGQLYEKYERLKRELEELGMFAPEYKQPIPKYSKTVGVVTADTGAAVRDIIQIAHRRNPYVQIILYPAIVQGQAAVPSIVNGIRGLERLGEEGAAPLRISGPSMSVKWLRRCLTVPFPLSPQWGTRRILPLLILWLICGRPHLLRRQSWQWRISGILCVS